MAEVGSRNVGGETEGSVGECRGSSVCLCVCVCGGGGGGVAKGVTVN